MSSDIVGRRRRGNDDGVQFGDATMRPCGVVTQCFMFIVAYEPFQDDNGRHTLRVLLRILDILCIMQLCKPSCKIQRIFNFTILSIQNVLTTFFAAAPNIFQISPKNFKTFGNRNLIHYKQFEIHLSALMIISSMFGHAQKYFYFFEIVMCITAKSFFLRQY